MMTFHPTKDVMKSGAGELPNILHPFVSLVATRTSAGGQLESGGQADGSRRASRWEPAGTHMEAGGHADGRRRVPTWELAGTHMGAGGHADGSWRERRWKLTSKSISPTTVTPSSKDK